MFAVKRYQAAGVGSSVQGAPLRGRVGVAGGRMRQWAAGRRTRRHRYGIGISDCIASTAGKRSTVSESSSASRAGNASGRAW